MFQWMQRTKGHIQEIIGIVSLFTGYGIAVTGKSPTPWPQTTAVGIVLVSTLFIWAQWWPRISKQTNLLLSPPTTTQIPWLEALLDPFRKSSRRPYSLPLTRRRTEGTVLSALTLGAFALCFFRVPAVIAEVFPSASPIPMTCVGDGSKQALRIVIAEFNKVGNAPLLEDRLFDLLTDHSKWIGKIRVCRTPTIIKNQSEAIELGKQTMSAIVVWGRSDPALYEVNLEVAEWDLPNVKLRSFPTPEAMTPEFQIREPLRTSFLAEYILSELLYIRGETLDARNLLEDALNSAKDEGLDGDTTNAEDLADAYFLLGYLYDAHSSSKPDPEVAIKYYSQAIGYKDDLDSAYLNRGKLYGNDAQTQALAIADYEKVIALTKNTNPKHAAAASINLAWLYVDSDRTLAEDYFGQAISLAPLLGHTDRGLARLFYWKQPALAIEDFSVALTLDSTDPDLFNYLGQAELLNQEPEKAIQTYQKGILTADWEPGDRDAMVSDLLALDKEFPDMHSSITAIIKNLRSSDLP